MTDDAPDEKEAHLLALCKPSDGLVPDGEHSHSGRVMPLSRQAARATGFLTNGSASIRIVRLSHPDPNGLPDLTPIQVGEVWENPVTGERGTILELPYTNPEGRATVELTALVGARVVGEHFHPALVERFTALEGELTVKRDGQKSILREGETAVIEPGVWHDWWNASDRDARVRVEAPASASLT